METVETSAHVTTQTEIEVTDALMQKLNIQGITPGQAAQYRKADIQDPRKMLSMSNKYVVGIEEGTRLAHKISRICIAQIRSCDTDLMGTVITTEDIQKLGYTKERITSHGQAIISEILSLRIKLSEVGTIGRAKNMAGINVFSSAAILPRQGAIVVRLNPDLKEHFLHLTQDYTSYEMRVAMQMNSVAASKLHEFLICRSRQYNAKILEVDVEDLKILLGYKPKDKKKKFSPSDFTNSTIKRAVQTINELTECQVKYVPVKTGRKITSIRFYVEAEWRTVKEKEDALQWIERTIEEDEAKGQLLLSAKENMMYELENGQTSIFPEDITELEAMKKNEATRQTV